MMVCLRPSAHTQQSEGEGAKSPSLFICSTEPKTRAAAFQRGVRLTTLTVVQILSEGGVSIVEVRSLNRADEAAVLQFLYSHTASSLFLISNLLNAGLVDGDERYQGRYLGVFRDDHLVGVGAHYWNQKLIVQAPDYAGLLAEAFTSSLTRPLDGLIGPWEQLMVAREALGVADSQVTLDSREILYTLSLAALTPPDPLDDQRFETRGALKEDLNFLVTWRVAYEQETSTTSGSRSEVREHLARILPTDDIWLAFADGVPVSQTGFNARVPGVVQLGGVWTPSEFRSRGYARRVISAHLQHAQGQDITEAILFTGAENICAQRCYESLGFQAVDEYGMLFFEPRFG